MIFAIAEKFIKIFVLNLCLHSALTNFSVLLEYCLNQKGYVQSVKSAPVCFPSLDGLPGGDKPDVLHSYHSVQEQLEPFLVVWRSKPTG
jgi:hypothetical protein